VENNDAIPGGTTPIAAGNGNNADYGGEGAMTQLCRKRKWHSGVAVVVMMCTGEEVDDILLGGDTDYTSGGIATSGNESQ
jgi:hypothetical protein